MRVEYNTIFIGKNRSFHEVIPSTNDFVLDLLDQSKLPEGYLVRAAFQSAGKGQADNFWESKMDENLLNSIVLYPKFLKPSDQFYLNQAISLAITSLLEQYITVQKVRIKWPNDIYVDNHKIAGILIQNSMNSNNWINAVIGIGLNVNQIFFDHAPKATSLNLVLNQRFDVETIGSRLAACIEQEYLRLKRGSFDSLNERYKAQLMLVEELASFSLPDGTRFEGVIKGVDKTGKLSVLVDKHIRLFAFKEIVFHI